MNATQSQIDYINKLKDSEIKYLEMGMHPHNGSFAVFKAAFKVRHGITGRIDSEMITDDYPVWLKAAKEALSFDPTQLSKQEASKMIDTLKRNPASLLPTDY